MRYTADAPENPREHFFAQQLEECRQLSGGPSRRLMSIDATWSNTTDTGVEHDPHLKGDVDGWLAAFSFVSSPEAPIICLTRGRGLKGHPTYRYFALETCSPTVRRKIAATMDDVPDLRDFYAECTHYFCEWDVQRGRRGAHVNHGPVIVEVDDGELPQHFFKEYAAPAARGLWKHPAGIDTSNVGGLNLSRFFHSGP